MNDNQNAFIMLTIVLCLVIYLSIMYKKQSTNTYESFYGSGSGSSSYQDIKTKTLNWCDKMQKTGLLTVEQLNECQSSFNDVKPGTLPKDFKIPDTGVSRNYSLYNTRINSLTPNVSGENTNTVMLVSNDGQYLACKPDNTIYYISNINEPSVNQQEIYFTLIPQNENVYVIMSPYGKYLIANQPDSGGDSGGDSKSNNIQDDWTATFTGSSIGTMVSWKINKVESENVNKVSFEAFKLDKFYLSSFKNKNNNSLSLIYGNNETMMWTMIPKPQNINSESAFSSVKTANTTTEYIVLGENIITKIINTKMEKICLQEIRTVLVKLQDTIRNQYANISNSMQQKLNYQKNVFIESNSQYMSSVNSISQSSSIPSDSQKQIISNIPKPNGIDITTETMNIVFNNIDNKKNYYLQSIQTDIVDIDKKINILNKTEIDANNDYNKYVIDITEKLKSIEFEIKQNNIIMDRQQQNYEKLNQDYSYIDNKKHKIENLDKTAKINTNLITNYKNKNGLIIKIYPIIIFIMILCMLYLAYNTYNKFMLNIYSQYV